MIESFNVTTTFPGDDDFPVMDVDELSCGDNTPNIPIDVQNNNHLYSLKTHHGEFDMTRPVQPGIVSGDEFLQL